jgi:electron transfer flavoprotein beta subunit
MRIAVFLKQVPDLVEEFEINDEGTDIDREFVTFLLNEFDNHALEEALLIKDEAGAEVDVIAFDDDDIDQALYTAIAKGADKAVKLSGAEASEARVDTRTRARILASWLQGQDYDLILTGVQAADDLDGQLAPMLGALVGLPHLSVVTGVEVTDGTARVQQEFAGGAVAELNVQLPVVIGVQTARSEPRYAPISKIRQAQQAGGLVEEEIDPPPAASGLTVRRMYPPEQTDHAEMLTGSDEDVAGRIIELLRERGLVTS